MWRAQCVFSVDVGTRQSRQYVPNLFRLTWPLLHLTTLILLPWLISPVDFINQHSAQTQPSAYSSREAHFFSFYATRFTPCASYRLLRCQRRRSSLSPYTEILPVIGVVRSLNASRTHVFVLHSISPSCNDSTSTGASSPP